MAVRPATHAGSWYSSDRNKLGSQLEQFIGSTQVVPHARVIVSPHAGYAYCGPTMGKAYGALDVSHVKTVFILGPSHHMYFRDKALVSRFQQLQTPLGNLHVDVKKTSELVKLKEFEYMDADVDCDEHSLEMQFSMLHKVLSLRRIDISQVQVVPIMISHNSTQVDQQLGQTLGQYLLQRDCVFIVSSDFCHWGRRFNYTGYVGEKGEIEEALKEDTEIESLTARSKLSHHQVPIWKSIELLDKFGMELLSQPEPRDKYGLWKQYIEVTGNTVCGEKPIGVLLCGLGSMGPSRGVKFTWPAYSQSSRVGNVMESSVSYGAGYCTI
ncbi:LAMI_0A07602g1_1 [Lachancea mirantina]|uniref:LAMI_0A07602g1_1 n=1 Tax=Lachancea mirantina TaxID=1230905 RepID=A0A1G4IQU4_9SACH|nr:LAMI_0A07602g1_1 [Lachancea mirantina]